MHLTRNPYLRKDLLGKAASLDDVSAIVDEPPLGVFAPNGEPILAYEQVDAPDLLGQVRTNMSTLRPMFIEDVRSRGLASRSCTFGYQPRITFRRNFCGVTRVTRDYPAEYERIADLADMAARFYRDAHRAAYEEHLARVSKDVLPEWLIRRTPFSGGIINDSAQLTYHRDKGNVSGSWSAMVVLRDEGCEGGYLVIPELDVAVGCTNGSVLLFQGERWWHGVSPIRRTKRDARRYSIVYYSLAAMRNCLCVADEVTRYKQVRTEREKNRLNGVRAQTSEARTHTR